MVQHQDKTKKQDGKIPAKVFVYKEYNDDTSYGEEIVEIHADKDAAEARLMARVERHFNEKWEKIPDLLGKEDVFTPHFVSFNKGCGTAFWIVEEHNVPEEEMGRMTLERAKELLNKVIDHVSVANSCHETIRRLMDLGFTGQELCDEFSFTLMDIMDAMDPEEDSEKEDSHD